MNEKQQLLFGETGQSLVWDAPEGRASAVNSVQVWRALTGDLGTAETATTGSASIDSANTTVDANSGASSANPRKLNVAATTNMVVGRRYLVTAATGESEWVLVQEIVAGDYIIAAHPLYNDYVSADTVVGTRLTISVHSTFVADTSKITDGLTDPNPGYRVRWDYTVASITRVHDAYFDLVRYAVQHTVQPIDMEALIPNWRDRLPTVLPPHGRGAANHRRGRASGAMGLPRVGTDAVQPAISRWTRRAGAPEGVAATGARRRRYG